MKNRKERLIGDETSNSSASREDWFVKGILEGDTAGRNTGDTS